VMYAGRVVEQADVLALFERPRHPYTAGLFESLPRSVAEPGQELPRLRPIQGVVPDPRSFPPGCRFHPRCPYAFEPCSTRAPELKAPRAGSPRLSACFYTEEHPDADYFEHRGAGVEGAPTGGAA